MIERLIGFDFGGTSIKAGAVTPAGEVLGERSAPNGLDVGPEEAFARMAAMWRELGGEVGAAAAGAGTEPGIGIGIAGLVDTAAGVVVQTPNLPGMDGVSLRDGLARATGLPPERIRVENDANAAALGEAWIGAARGEPHAIVVTLGTGVGGGLILDGRPFSGAGMGGEIGHVVVDPLGPVCGCGSRGCLETLASATAARARATAAGLPADDPGNLELLTERAAASPGPERALLEAVGTDLGRGLALALCLLDVRLFVFSGGFSAAFEQLEPGIRAGLRERAFGERVAEVRLRRAQLGPAAGWIGAAALARRH